MASKSSSPPKNPAPELPPTPEQLTQKLADKEAEILRLRPDAEQYRQQKADIARQRNQLDTEKIQLELAQKHAKDSREVLDAERSRLRAEAAEVVEAEKAKLRTRLDKEAADARTEAELLREQAVAEAEKVRKDADTLRNRLTGEGVLLRQEADQYHRERLGHAEKLALGALEQSQEDANRLREQTRSDLQRLRQEAEQTLAAQRDAAHNEIIDLRTKAQNDCMAQRQEAQRDAAATREAGRKEATATLEKAAVEATKLRTDAVKEAEAVKTAAVAQVERDRAAAERLVKQAEAQVAELLRSGEELGRTRGEKQYQTLLAEAEALVADRNDRLRQREEKLRRAELDRDEADRSLTEREWDLERREAALLLEQQRLDHQRRLLEAQEAELERESNDLSQRLHALAEAEGRVGAARVARLEEECAELREMLEESRQRNREVVLEREQLREWMESVGGADAGARAAELERLRQEKQGLQLELATRPAAADLERLQSELQKKQDAESREREAIRRAHELERAQLGVDQTVRNARIEAERTVQEVRLKAEQELRAAENLTAAAQAETARHQTEIDRLAAEKSVLEEEKSIWLEIEQQSRRAAQALGDLQIDRDFLEARVHELQRALEDRTRLAKMRAHDRYGKLVELDEKPEVFGHPQGQTLPFAQEKPMGKLPVSLKTLVGQLRNNMAADGRYYTEKLVRTWLASLAAHRMQILKGVSGTGKTSLPIHFAKALGGPCTVIPVQSGWRDRADLVGFFNTFDNRLRVTPFSEAIYRANLPDFQDRPVFVVLDECNLSRVEYYAADLLSDLELDPEKSGMDKLGAEGWDRAMQHYRHPPHLIQICDQGENEAAPQHLHQGRFLALPPNVWIVGTANEDESTFEIADKTLDRAGILPMDSRATPEKKAPVELPPVSWSALSGAFTEAAQKCKRKDQLHDFVSKLTPDLEQRFEIGLGNRFEMQAEKFLPVYESSGGTVEEGIDHLLRTRVLRKVERIRDPGRVREIRELTETIQKQPWGAKCTESLDLLRRVVDRLEGRR